MKQHAEAGHSQEDLKKDDIFEIHMSKIALHDYKGRTSNYSGAEYVSGRGAGLLPIKFAQKAADFANPTKKLQNSLGGGSTKGTQKGKGGAGAPCCYCGELGHIAKDCRKKEADIEAGIITSQPKGKGRQGQMRAKFVVKAEGGDNA